MADRLPSDEDVSQERNPQPSTPWAWTASMAIVVGSLLLLSAALN